MIKYQYRVTKYDPRFRDSADSYLRDEWVGPEDIGREIGGRVLTEDEFELTVNKYLYVVEAFARESGVDRLTAVGVQDFAPVDEVWAPVREGTTVPLDRALELVRSELRGTALGAPLEDSDRFYVHVADRMYVYLGSHVDCVRATAEAERIGLFVEPGHASPFEVTEEERFWWLREGAPVRHILVSEDPATGASLGRRPYPEDRVPALRALFPPRADDPEFLDLYDIGEARRPRVEEVLGVRLDPAQTHRLWTEN